MQNSKCKQSVTRKLEHSAWRVHQFAPRNAAFAFCILHFEFCITHDRETYGAYPVCRLPPLSCRVASAESGETSPPLQTDGASNGRCARNPARKRESAPPD